MESSNIAPPRPELPENEGWEDVYNPDKGNTVSRGDVTQRLRIPGGYLYRTTIYDTAHHTIAVAMVFVSASDTPGGPGRS